MSQIYGPFVALVSRLARVVFFRGVCCAWCAHKKKEKKEDAKKAEKRMRYKDVVREQILSAQTAADAISSDEDDDDGNENDGRSRGAQRMGLAYDEEQEHLRGGFLGSVAEHEGRRNGGSGESDSGGEGSGEDGDGLLKVCCRLWYGRVCGVEFFFLVCGVLSGVVSAKTWLGLAFFFFFCFQGTKKKKSLNPPAFVLSCFDFCSVCLTTSRESPVASSAHAFD